MESNRKKRLMGAGGVVVATIIAYAGYNAYFFVSTDNAMIAGPTTLLSSKVSGVIVKAEVRENEKVKAGQLLAEIRPDDYRNAVEMAQSDRDALAAQLKGATSSYDRTNGLFRKGASTQERVDSTGAEFHAMESKLRAAEAKLSQAKLDLEYTRIVAPADGIVGRKSYEVGMLAAAGQPLLGFIAGGERWVVANLKETDMAHVAVGKKAYLTVDALPGREFEGEVESISPTTGATFSLLPPDNATGNFTKVVQRIPVRIKLLKLNETDIDKLQAGLSAEVRVKIR